MDYNIDAIRKQCLDKLFSEYSDRLSKGTPLPEKLNTQQKLNAFANFFYCSTRKWSDINAGDFYTSCRNDSELYRVLYASREQNIVITCYMSCLEGYFNKTQQLDNWTYDNFVSPESFHSERVPVPDWIFDVDPSLSDFELQKKVAQGDPQFDMPFDDVRNTINYMHLNAVQIDTINKLQAFLDNRENEIKTLYALLENHIDGSFAQGARCLFDVIKYRMANEFHDNPAIQASIDQKHEQIDEFLEEALEDVAPNVSMKWKEVKTLLDQVHSLIFENDELKRKLSNGTERR